MFSLLAATGDLLPNWVVNSFPIIKFILLILVIISAILLIIFVMMQDTSESGTNAITGLKDTYYAQNKGMTRDGRLKKITIALSIFIAVAVIVFFVLHEIYPGTLWS